VVAEGVGELAHLELFAAAVEEAVLVHMARS
jgi:hypothetical protein